MAQKSSRVRAVAPIPPLLLLAGFAIGLPGCAPRLGSKTLARDRFDYSAAISTSWKEQMLLNLVKVRYADPPVFLDVQQIVTQYTFEASATINAPHWDGVSADDPAATATGRWTESPTITFNPLTGETYIRSLIRPIAPAELIGLVEAGWPIDTIFGIGVGSINGIDASTHTMNKNEPGNPDFYRVLTLLRQLQDSGAVALRMEDRNAEPDSHKDGYDLFDQDKEEPKQKSKSPPTFAILILRDHALDEAGQRASQEVRRLLRLNPDANEFSLVFGATSHDDREVALLTRSMLGILLEASVGVDVSPSDVQEGRAIEMETGAQNGKNKFLVLRVHSSETKPPAEDVFSMVHYRHQWFWVDDRDLRSKRGLGFLMAVFTVLKSGATAAPPVLTISRP